MRTDPPSQGLIEQLVKRGAHVSGRFGSLFGGDLRDVKFAGENLSHWKFAAIDFHGADLAGVSLSNGELVGCKFIGANLSGADLTAVRIMATDFTDANLSTSVMAMTEFINCDLGGASLEDATTFTTLFANQNLSDTRGLDSIKHMGPSILGIDTLLQSGGKIPQEFLRGCGLDPLIQEILIGTPASQSDAFTHWLSKGHRPFQRCFISYATEDRRFVDRLQKALNEKGVDYWYAPEHGAWGDSLQEQIDREISLRDRMLLVCSETSLQKDWVSHEIDQAIENEKKRGQRIIFPIMIDDGLEKWTDPRKSRIWTVLAADFRGAARGRAFEQRMERLLEALRAEKVSLPRT